MSDVNDLIKNLSAQVEKASSNFSAKAESALKEAQSAGQLSETTKAAVDKLATEFNALKEAEKTIKASLGVLEQHVAQMPVAHAVQVAQSLGQVVIEAEQVKALSSSMERGKYVSVGVNAALLSADVPAGIVEPHRLPGIDVTPKQRLFIRDLIAPGKTTSSTIYWVRQTGFTNAAKVVPEGETKPYSDIKFDSEMTAVVTLAHMFKTSKQILDDFSQLQSQIDSELRYGLKYVEEQEILYGKGGSNNIHGIVPQAAKFDPAFKVDSQNGIDELRLAMLQAQLAMFPASGHVLHFTDWAQIELVKDTLGRYILGNPSGLAVPTLWGLPVVQTQSSEFKGKFLTGAFNAGAQIFDREEINVMISTENVDDFEKNMISIRCEERFALAVKRPEAFIYGTFTHPVAPKASK